MNRIDATFQRLRDEGRAAFIPFFTAGDPDPDTTEELIARAGEAGADLIELGFPMSDPVADGPTIQASYTRVLERGQKCEDVFRMAERARERTDIPLVAMISYTLVFKMGHEAFVERAIEAGFDGATIPDLPIEEAEGLHEMCREKDFRLICFATPATTDERRDMVAEHARGFIYYIAVRGITGERSALPPDLVENIEDLKSRTGVPVAVGFGISAPEHAREVGKVADGVIVGSAILRRINEAAESCGDPVGAATDFISDMSRAAKGLDEGE
ncbi:MAG: tryptophan synthase subunit alpha [Planctomycetota bacterium]